MPDPIRRNWSTLSERLKFNYANRAERDRGFDPFEAKENLITKQ